MGTDNLRIGVLGGYDYARLQVDDRLSTASLDDYHVGLYGTYRKGGFSANAGASYSWRQAHVRRTVLYPGYQDRLTGNYSTRIAQGFLELSYALPMSDAVTFEPTAGIAYVNVDTKDFTESGGASALTHFGRSKGAIVTSLGARASIDLGGVNLRGTGAWRHTGGNGLAAVRVSLPGSVPFEVQGPNVARNSFVGDIGLEGQASGNLFLSIAGTAVENGKLSGYGLKAKARLSF